MNPNFKSNERELVKIATYFKKESKRLIEEGMLGEEHKKVEEAVDRFIEHIEQHANTRQSILEQRDSLTRLVKDDASCPTCNKKDMLKVVGTEANEKGWKSNRYRCRRCNIEFTWNRPNNPWDMLEYIQAVLDMMRLRVTDASVSDEEKEQIKGAIDSMEGNVARLQPVIDAHNTEWDALQKREEEMDKLVHEFKNTLLIEKIKMDTWENKNRT
ncbi:MAG TPA: hypothetical protein VGD65_18685 [Chryseosolibacter sp.]